MRDFKTLAVWQKAHRLTIDIYQSTERFPKEELYGLTSQIRRACASIPMNIAEGCGRGSDPEFAHFLSIAMGSASELECQLLLTRDLGLLKQSEYDRLEPALIEVKRMMNSFIQKLKANR